MKICVLQNDSLAGPAHLDVWAQARGHELDLRNLYAGEKQPSRSEVEALVILGGTMAVYEQSEHRWLSEEIALIKDVVADGKRVLGICLGAQLLASALGARVYKGPYQEIGWFQVELSDEATRDPLFAGFPPRFTGFHYHGDTFDLPAESVKLGSSHVYENQMFLWGRTALGVQFHPEVDEGTLLKWVESTKNELPRYPVEPFVQGPHEILNQDERVERQNRLFATLLDRFFSRP